MDQVNTRDLRNSLKGKGEKRQVILSGRKGKTYSDFIEKETENTIKVIASEQEPLVVSLADGFGELGQIDYTKRFTQDFTGVPVEPNATNFVLLEKDSSDLYTVKTTKQEPIYGSSLTSDRENKIAATFNAPAGAKRFTDLYDNVFEFYGAAEITNTYQIHGGNTASFPGSAGSYAICRPRSWNTSELDDWTIEFDVKFNVLGTVVALLDNNGNNNTGLHLTRSSDNYMYFYMGDGSSTWLINAGQILSDTGSTFNITTVYNVVILFQKLVVKVYINGVLRYINNIFASTSYWNYKTPYSDAIVLGIRGDYVSNPLNGYIANFQFWPYAKYSNLTNSGIRTLGTTVFAPSNTQCTLDTNLPQRYIKNNKSIYFDFEGAEGSTDITDYYGNKLHVTHSASDAVHSPRVGSFYPAKFGTRCLVRLASVYSANRAQVKVDLDTSKWTIEFWHYYDDSIGAYTILYTDADFSISISKGATNELIVLLGNGASWINTMTSAINLLTVGDWHHIAVSYDGFKYRMFCNGSLQGTYTPSSRFEIYKPGWLTFGHPITDVNCTRDSAYDDFAVHNYCKYNINFTLPTEPLSNSIEPMYYYDIPKAEMYKGFYGSLAKQPAIFLGEVNTVGNEIDDITSYSIGAKTGPIQFTGIPNENFANATYFKHNIGDTNLDIGIDFVFTRNYAGYIPGERIKDVESYYDQYTLKTISNLSRNIFSHVANTNTYMILLKSGTAPAGAVSASVGVGYVEFNVERTW